MIKVEHIEVFNFEGAIRGLRNPMNSWDKSDSIKCYANRNCPGICKNNSCGLCVGAADLDLMKRLFKAGTEHRKYLRQIFVSMDITAPLYWWKEFSTYKIGTVENSCSTMHKIAAKEFTVDDFSHEHLTDGANDTLSELITELNLQRDLWNETKEKCYWWGMIQLLPTSYNQRRTITMDYENVFSIIKQRSGHKLDEWNEFVKILKTLPYVMEIGGYNDNDQLIAFDIERLPPAQGKPFNLPEIYIADGYDTIEGEDGNVGFGVYVPDENQIYVAGDVEDEIRARALLHEVCHWVQDMCGRPFDEDEANEFSDIVYDALPSAQPEQRWIPCSERLPEEDVEVLISYRYKEGEGDTSHTYIDITTYGQMYFGGNKVGNHKHWRAPFEYFESNYEVIAWMPLPEPYKERREE